MSTNINDVLNKTINIYNKVKDFKDKYRDEWQVILKELESLVPPKESQWNLTDESLPQVGDFIITLGPDSYALENTFEYNLLVFDGDKNKLHRLWLKLPEVQV